MSAMIRGLAVLGVGLSIGAGVEAAPPAHARNDMQTYIVTFKKDRLPAQAAERLAQLHAGSVRAVYTKALNGAAITVPKARFAALSKDDSIAFIEEDKKVKAFAQTVDFGVQRMNGVHNAMAKIDGVDERMNVDIAIIDSGIDLDHPDLNVFHYADCTNPQPNGCKDMDAGANDVYGHGTHVAGIAAAIDNAAGTVGVAPGARLWAVKALQDNGSGDGADIIKAVDYIAQHGSEIEVVNMSLGGLGTFTSLDNAISNTMQASTPLVSGGVVFVVAAGNDAFNMDDPAINVFPAEHPDVITVSAFTDLDGLPGALGTVGGWTFSIPCDVNDYGTNSCKCTEKVDDSFACFSNYGSAVDLMAPGVRIKSSKAGGGTTNMFGTSMAAPHVAGVAALYAICNPTATPNDVRQGLTVGRPGDNGIDCVP